MRGQGAHIPPLLTQPCPTDNTYPHVATQLALWLDSGVPVHQEVAREIAAWWQAPDGDGHDFAAFQSTGTILDDLDASIDRAICATTDGSDGTDVAMLRALGAYVRASAVTVWTTGTAVVGYIPEGDVTATLDYGVAWDAWVEALREAPDGTDSAGDCLCAEPPWVEVTELCEACALQATVEAYIRDDAPRRDGRREGVLYVTYDHLPLPIVHWLYSDVITYGEFIEQYRSEEY